MKAVKQREDTTRPLLWVLLVLSAVGIGVTIIMIVILQQYSPSKSVGNFQECKDAGGTVAESYPEQCFLDGKSFVNDAQRANNPDDYIGLTEQEALDKADQNGTPRRVVERDSETLPVTMDYVLGRVNLYVKEGKVYKVEVEGESK